MKIRFSLFVLLLALRIACSGKTLFVSLVATNPVPPYSAWNTAAASIQDAVDTSINGDLILVTNGIYQTGGRVVFGSLTNRVVVNKPVVVQSVNGAGVTVIQGLTNNGSGIPSPGDNSMRCVYLTNDAALIGFTLVAGTTRNSGDITNEECGGGLWCEAGAVVSNCVIVGSSSFNRGGGIYGGTIWNSVIATNLAGLGGGVSSATLFNCSVVSNSTRRIYGNSGGGAERCTLSNCMIARNFSYTVGGGATGCTLDGCMISNNVVFYLGNGGGVCNSSLTNCVIVGNGGSFANYSIGGGAYGSTLTSCLVYSNSAQYGGGANASILNNCTLAKNTAGVSGGGVGGDTGYGSASSTLRNCILYYNTAPAGSNYLVGASNLSFCCTAPLPAQGAGNFTNSPLFINISNDFHLQANSPCINAGNNSYSVNLADLEGNPRIVANTVDVGAYEFQTPGSMLSYAWASQYALPPDGSADFTDADGDGMNNWQEWIAGTNPTNASSALKMLMPLYPNVPPGLMIRWQSVTNRNYFVQSATNLVPAIFSTIATNLPGQPNITTFTDTNIAGSLRMFYRVGVQ